MPAAIRRAGPEDLPAIVELSEQKRIQYEAYQPLFWRKAPDSRTRQAPFLQQQMARENVIALVHQRDGDVDGFVIAALVPSPPVNAAGLTCVIDDFHVRQQDWAGVGGALLEAVGAIARDRGAVQTVVVCGHLDQAKRQMLLGAGHSIVSEWWVRPIG